MLDCVSVHVSVSLCVCQCVCPCLYVCRCVCVCVCVCLYAFVCTYMFSASLPLSSLHRRSVQASLFVRVVSKRNFAKDYITVNLGLFIYISIAKDASYHNQQHTHTILICAVYAWQKLLPLAFRFGNLSPPPLSLSHTYTSCWYSTEPKRSCR